MKKFIKIPTFSVRFHSPKCAASQVRQRHPARPESRENIRGKASFACRCHGSQLPSRPVFPADPAYTLYCECPAPSYYPPSTTPPPPSQTTTISRAPRFLESRHKIEPLSWVAQADDPLLNYISLSSSVRSKRPCDKTGGPAC